MVLRGLVGAIALGLAAVTSVGAAEPGPGTGELPCFLGDANFASRVKPLYSHEDSGYTAFDQFRGAEVFVPALPGLTAEWLDRVLTAQVTAGECDFGVPKVNVDVLSDGGGFSVRLSSDDEKGAAEVLRRAQQMVK
jgi:hypothetical protein